MKKKKLIIALSALAIMGMATMTVFGANLTETQAKDLAEDYVPAGSTYYKTKDENGIYEFKFYNEKLLEKYEIEISKESQKLLSFESEKYDNHGSSNVKLTSKEAEAVVSGEIDDAKILSSKLDVDDGYQEYDVYFTTGSYSGKYTIHAENGTILEREVKIGVKQTSTSADSLLSIEDIRKLTENEIPGGTITDIDLEEEKGGYIYEAETYKDGVEYELIFDAATGSLLWTESDSGDWNGHNSYGHDVYDHDDHEDHDDDHDDDDHEYHGDDDHEYHSYDSGRHDSEYHNAGRHERGHH